MGIDRGPHEWCGCKHPHNYQSCLALNCHKPDVLIPDPPQASPAKSEPLGLVDQKTELKCTRYSCNRTIFPAFLTSEDEAMIQYDGACPSCGQEYHLILKKEQL